MWAGPVSLANEIELTDITKAETLSERLDLNYRLFEAIERGDAQQVCELVLQGVDLNLKWVTGDTPLIFAIKQRNEEIAKFFGSPSRHRCKLSK